MIRDKLLLTDDEAVEGNRTWIKQWVMTSLILIIVFISPLVMEIVFISDKIETYRTKLYSPVLV